MNKYQLLFLLSFMGLNAQEKPIIDKNEVVRIETELASDRMQGRKIFTAGIDSASVFIEKEFSKIGLEFYSNLKNYRQEFVAKNKPANNVIAMIKGKSKPEEFVIFSAHFDHLGTDGSRKDTIYNGANDDASGVTAVILLANYFKKMNSNERTLLFVCFTGEEVGGFGSGFFSKNINADKVVAMFNIEMIGTESKWGKNSCYITGFDKSDFGTILQKNLKGSNFNFYEDPYPTEQLFYRSDNARLAALGVPAHTISTSKMDSEANYHQLSDEVATLDLENMTQVIKSIAQSSESIVKAIDTPKRVKKLRDD